MIATAWDVGKVWDPFEAISRIRDEMFSPPESEPYPPLNVWADEDALEVTAELPGIDSKSLDVAVEGHTLTLRASRPVETPKESALSRRERPAGTFVRTLELPVRVDADKARASYKDGVLRVVFPRREADKPRRIAVALDRQ
ncbi:MAG: Hsp20/alpha crystallin family protein [Elusimicrobiota bacterium]|jgi:HSP20 family protein